MWKRVTRFHMAFVFLLTIIDTCQDRQPNRRISLTGGFVEKQIWRNLGITASTG